MSIYLHLQPYCFFHPWQHVATFAYLCLQFLWSYPPPHQNTPPKAWKNGKNVYHIGLHIYLFNAERMKNLIWQLVIFNGMSTKSLVKERLQFRREGNDKKICWMGEKRWDTLITNLNTEGIKDLKKTLGERQGGDNIRMLCREDLSVWQGTPASRPLPYPGFLFRLPRKHKPQNPPGTPPPEHR